MVKSIYKRMIPGKKSRQVLAYMFLFFSILFGTGPLLIQPEVRRAEPNFINSGQLPVNSKKNSNAKKNSLSSKEIKHVETSTRNTISGTSRGAKTSPHEKYKYADINVDGSMTMKEITSRYNLSCSDFAKSIQVPVEHANVPFGRLRKKYGFRISEIKEYIQRHAK